MHYAFFILHSRFQRAKLQFETIHILSGARVGSASVMHA